MCIRRFVVILASCCLLTGLAVLAGCTAEQIAAIDKGVQDANQAAAGGKAVADSPAGTFLPPMVKQGIGIAYLVATGVAGWWGRNKYKLLRQTASTVVQAVDSLPDDQSAAVKDRVGGAMTDAAKDSKGITYKAMNAVVDSLKAK